MTINPIFHARTKHLELDYHFVRQKSTNGALVTSLSLLHYKLWIFSQRLHQKPCSGISNRSLPFIKCHLLAWGGMLSKLIKITKRKVINSQINKGFITSHNLLKSKLFVKEYLHRDFKLKCQYHVRIFHSYFIKILCNSLGSIHLFSFNIIKHFNGYFVFICINNFVNFINKHNKNYILHRSFSNQCLTIQQNDFQHYEMINDNVKY